MAADPRGADRAQRVRSFLGTLPLALLGADVGVRVLGRVRTAAGPARLRVRVVPASRPGTVVRVPPLGSARLRTHAGTVAVEATLDGVEEADVRGLARGLQGGRPDTDALLADVRRSLTRSGRSLAVRAALGSVVGGAVGGWARGRRWTDAAAGAVVGASMVGGQGLLIGKTFRADAWRDPAYTGLLQHVPDVVGRLEELPQRWPAYRKLLGEVVSTVTGVVRGLDAMPDVPVSVTRLVHVSDIHLNPLAYDVCRALVRAYDAAAVLDTGDSTDWGSDAEKRTLAPIGDLGVPYVYVKGNHDSDRIAAAVGKYANAVVLDGGVVEVAGVRLAGGPDPRFTPDKASGGDDMTAEEIATYGERLAAGIADGAADVAMVHDPVMGGPLSGRVPLVLSGHTHRRIVRRTRGTLHLVEGSTGGAGLRGVRSDPPHPVELSVLHLDADRRLVAVDRVTLGGLGRSEVTLERVPEAELDPRDPPPERPTW